MRVLRWALLAASLLAAVLVTAETPSPENPDGVLSLTARTANLAGSPDDIRIEILRWSTDDERERLMAAWNLQPGAAGGGRGAGKGLAGRAGKGGFAGKGAPKGLAAPAAAPPPVPDEALAKALQETTTVGYLWSSEIAGYALRYAGKISSPNGSERIVLITQRRLGAMNQLWSPRFPGAANNYGFSVIELRLNAKGEGEGKASLAGVVAPDAAAKMVTLQNYDALPVVFTGVRSSPAKK
jgi:hypothetical protein